MMCWIVLYAWVYYRSIKAAAGGKRRAFHGVHCYDVAIGAAFTLIRFLAQTPLSSVSPSSFMSVLK